MLILYKSEHDLNMAMLTGGHTIHVLQAIYWLNKMMNQFSVNSLQCVRVDQLTHFIFKSSHVCKDHHDRDEDQVIQCAITCKFCVRLISIKGNRWRHWDSMYSLNPWCRGC